MRLTRKGEVEFEKQANAHESWVSELLGGLDGSQSAALTKDLTIALKIKGGLDEH